MTDETGNVVNLNKFRKAKARGEKDQKASANRAAHGRTRAEKAKDRLEKAKHEDTVDQHKVDEPPEDKDPA